MDVTWATRLLKEAQADRAAAVERIAEAQRHINGANMIIQGCLILYPDLAESTGEQANLPRPKSSWRPTNRRTVSQGHQ